VLFSSLTLKFVAGCPPGKRETKILSYSPKEKEQMATQSRRELIKENQDLVDQNEELREGLENVTNILVDLGFIEDEDDPSESDSEIESETED